MVIFRASFLMVSLIAAGGLLAAGTVGAGEKKPEKKPPAGGSLLNKSDQLTDQDEKDTADFLKDSPRKVYKIKLTEGKSYQIDLKSMDFDAVLRLEDPDGKQVAFNDDFEPGKSLDSRIIYKAPKSAEYKIIATCLDAKTGKFTLTVVEAGSGASASMFKGKGTELKAKDGKGRFEGELTDKDPVARNHYYKVFTFKMEAGKSYRIDHMSDDFDAYLFLEDPDGNTLAQDDDGGEGLNSRIIHKAKTTGLYRIIPTTLPAKTTGKFILEVKAASADEEKEVSYRERVMDAVKLTPADRKKLADEIRKYIGGLDGHLTIGQAQTMFQLGMLLEDDDLKTAREFYKDAIKEFGAARNDKLSAQVTGAFENALKTLEKIGQTIDIVGTTLNGKDFDLKNLKGKVVLVDFWGTWCGPCVAEIPNMVTAYQKYHKRGFDIIGVSSDKDDEVVTKFMQGRKLPWQCINVEDGRKLIDQHGVNSFPTPILVDQSGRIVSMRARGPQLEQLLEKLLPAKK